MDPEEQVYRSKERYTIEILPHSMMPNIMQYHVTNSIGMLVGIHSEEDFNALYETETAISETVQAAKPKPATM